MFYALTAVATIRGERGPVEPRKQDRAADGTNCRLRGGGTWRCIHDADTALILELDGLPEWEERLLDTPGAFGARGWDAFVAGVLGGSGRLVDAVRPALDGRVPLKPGIAQ